MEHQHKSQDRPQHSMSPSMGNAGHDHHKMMIEDFRKRFYVTLIITVPVMLLSPMIQQWFHFNISYTGSATHALLTMATLK